MPSYGYDFKKAGKQADEKLHHIVIHMPSADTDGKHVIEHYFEGSNRPDKYEFENEEGPELVRHLSQSLGVHEDPGEHGHSKSDYPELKTKL